MVTSPSYLKSANQCRMKNNDACISRSTRWKPTHNLGIDGRQTDRPMVQLDDGRMAYTDRRKKNGEKLCPQLIREDNHRKKLPMFHSQQQILTRPKTISSTWNLSSAQVDTSWVSRRSRQWSTTVGTISQSVTKTEVNERAIVDLGQRDKTTYRIWSAQRTCLHRQSDTIVFIVRDRNRPSPKSS